MLQLVNEEVNLSPQDRIDSLIRVKKETVEKKGALQYWTKAYLKNSTVQEFLLSVANAKLELSSSERIKISMKLLVDENELSVLDTLDFPAFSKWLYPTKHLTDKQAEVVDFQSFITFLEKTLSFQVQIYL